MMKVAAVTDSKVALAAAVVVTAVLEAAVAMAADRTGSHSPHKSCSL